MGFLQQFHLVIRYKKGIHNKVVDMLSISPSTIATILKNNSITHESYIEQYAEDTDFKEVYATLSHGKRA
jgi:intein-encoded DNA endonuclease-like protein